MKAETLKKSILQYAMQGKLVEQNPDDEPASELLKRIKAEKEQLIKDGKIKKEKPLPPIKDNEIPYELPKGWEWARLNNICKLEAGQKVCNVSLPLLNAKYLRHKLDKQICNDGILVNKDDYIILVDGENSGEIFQSCEDGIMGSTFKKLEISAYCNIEYVLYILKFFQDLFRGSKKGAAIPHLDKNLFKNIVVGLPPIQEQQRIVERLEQILPLVEEYGKNEEKLSELNKTLPDKIKQSIVQHAIQGKLVPQNLNDEPASELLKRIKSEKEQLIKDGIIKKEKPLPPITDEEIPYKLPKSWEWVRLGEIVNYGSTGNLEYSEELDKNMWILDLEDIEKVSSKLLVKNRIKEKSFNSTKKCFQKGDVLYGKLRPYLDKVIVADENGICTTEILPLRIYNDINPYYLRWVLKNPTFLQYVNQLTYGVKMPRLGTEDGKNALIPVPPLAEQQRIVDKIGELMSIVDALKVK